MIAITLHSPLPSFVAYSGSTLEPSDGDSAVFVYGLGPAGGPPELVLALAQYPRFPAERARAMGGALLDAVRPRAAMLVLANLSGRFLV